MALFSADDITYPPLDVPKPVADGVWIVDSGPLRVFGVLGLPIRMTVLRLSSGDMLMHSPTRFDARIKADIEAHGPIRHLVAPLLTDLVVNLEADKLPLHARAFAWATGVLAPDGKAPAYLRFIVKRRATVAREAARRLVALDPERVIFAHGRWFERDGAAQVRRSFGWLLR